MVCMILLWLGVGNVLSIALPTRDEPIRKRHQSGSLKQFLIAFVASYLIGYLVNVMLIWRVLAAQELADRLGNALIPGVLIVLSASCGSCSPCSRSHWPSSRRSAGRCRRRSPTTGNAEAQAFAAEQAAAAAAPMTAAERPTSA